MELRRQFSQKKKEKKVEVKNKSQKVKRRLNISASNTAPNEKIADSMREANNYINTQIKLHSLTPISEPDPEIISMASSLACTMYNYWQTPIKDRNLEATHEWKKAIQDHIMAAYGRFNPTGLYGEKVFGKTTGFARRST